MSSEATKQAARTAIQKISGTYNIDIVEIINATVVSVDKEKRVCVVKPLSGQSDTIIENVGLMPERNDGEFKVPTLDSTVGVVKSTLVDPYIISWSDLDEWEIVIGNTTINMLDGSIKFGDGSYDGLVKIADLVDKLNNLESLVNNILNTLKATTIPLAPSGTYPFAPLYAAFNNLTPTTQNDIENPDITHGTTT